MQGVCLDDLALLIHCIRERGRTTSIRFGPCCGLALAGS